MIARVYITLKSGVLDPQGKTVHKSLDSLGFSGIQNVRIGKYVEVKLDNGTSESDAKEKVTRMCQKLLANEVIEDFRFELTHDKA